MEEETIIDNRLLQLQENTANFSPTSKLFASRSGFADLPRESLTNFDDFGRESLGIIDLNASDFRRESLLFLNNSAISDFGRESLGIVNLDNFDIARESLGISNIDIPDILISRTNNDCLNNNSAHLNTAFILQSRLSLSSSTSLNPSFYLEPTPSRLFSVTASTINSTSSQEILNKAFGDTSMFLRQFQKSGTFSTNNILNPLEKRNEFIHSNRISSMPSSLQIKEEIGHPYKSADASAGLITQYGDQDDFNDSVFIEAEHIASKLANGCQLKDIEPEDDMLDSTQPPENLFDDQLEDNDEPSKCDTETVFKRIDQLFAPKIITTEASVCEEKEINSEPSQRELVSSTNSASSSSSLKSKSAIEMLNSLTEIFLSNATPTEQQKIEGKQIISSLTELFTNGNTPKSELNDDSGLSDDAVNNGVQEKPMYYEILDLRTSSGAVSEDNISATTPLDLSLRSKSTSQCAVFMSPKAQPSKAANKRKSLSLSFNAADLNRDNNRPENIKKDHVVSVSHSESRVFNSLSQKFKPKKVEQKKTGPLKAVIPIANMKRFSGGGLQTQGTPSRIQKPNYRFKKTSTPINEPKLKPMAQSTPEGYYLTPEEEKSEANIKTPNMIKQKLNYSDSFENKPGLRRRSVTELKKPDASKSKLLARSFSTGRDSDLLKSASKAREIARMGRKSCDSVLNENVKTVRRLPSFKKYGKENAVH